MAGKKRTTYHHGALREALLASGERILRTQGLPALTLRAIARDANVSHAAPAHHFRDRTDLLSALAASGFDRLSTAIARALEQKHKPRAAAHAYVAFAAENPALFQLMFRGEVLDNTNTVLRAARDRALRALALGSASRTSPSRSASSELSLAQVGAMTAGWSLVHGFAMLMIDGPLAAMLRLAPPATDTDALLDAALAAVRSR